MKVTLKVRFHAKQHNNRRSGMNVTLKVRFHAKQHNNGRSDFMLNNTITGGQG